MRTKNILQDNFNINKISDKNLISPHFYKLYHILNRKHHFIHSAMPPLIKCT
jgi:hypothetical protein